MRFHPLRVALCALACAAVVSFELAAQAPPIVGSAPVRLTVSNNNPFVTDAFTADISIDLSAISGVGSAGPAPAGLTAFRIPVRFDRARVELTAAGPGQDPAFAAAALDATALADANANGRVVLAATVSANTPVGVVSVATLSFRATAGGPATISADPAGLSLASAIDVREATLFGPAAIPAQSSGGGVVVQTPPSLRAALEAGPSPIASGGQLIYDVRVTNDGGSTAHGVVLTAPIPEGTTVMAVGSGGASHDALLQWNVGDLAAAATFQAFVSLSVTAPAGTTISGAPATASATDAADAASAPVQVHVAATASALRPGAILAAASNQAGDEAIYDVTSGSPVFFARIPSGGWIGSMLITPTGRLFVTSDAYGGAIFDATAGGDLTRATPFARGLATGLVSLVRDAAGNFYAVSLGSTKIFRVAPNGEVTTLPVEVQSPGGLIVVDGTLYVSEGGIGSIRAVDLSSGAATTFATGFPAGAYLFSGQLVRNSLGRLFVLWGHDGVNLGLFDVTAAGDFSAALPVTAHAAFRTDNNQMAVDASDNVYFAGDGSGAVWRSSFANGAYGAAAVFARNVRDCEALAIYPRPTTPLLSLAASASAAEAVSTFPLTFTVTYANDGGTTASDTTLTATLPDGVSFVSATGGGVASGNQVSWSLGSLAASASGVRSFTVNVTAPPTATLAAATCSLSAAGGISAAASLPSLPVVAPPSLSVQVTPSSGGVPSGSSLAWTIAFRNDGGSPATNVVVTDSVPELAGANAAFTVASGNGVLTGTTVTWHIPLLAAGESAVETLVVRAAGPAGASITNNGGRITADHLSVLAGTPVVTPITAASQLGLTLVAAPSPVIPRSQINVVVQYTNSAAAAATDVVIVAPIPSDAELLSVTGGGEVSDGSLTWTIPSLAAGGSGRVRYSFRTNAPAGSRVPLLGTIRSTDYPEPAGAAASFSVLPLPEFYVPGSIYFAQSFNGPRLVYRLVSPTSIPLFVTPPSTYWLGSLHVAPNGHLYAAIDSPNGTGGGAMVVDITAGGDLRTATPLARDLGDNPMSMTSDEAGNLYVVFGNPGDGPLAIRRISPEGEVDLLPPLFLHASALHYDSGSLYVAEGSSGTVWKVDLSTFERTAFATGFPAGFAPSGQMVRNQQGRLYVLWGNPATRANLGLFDITDGGTYPSLQPVTAAGAFRIDVNQLALAPDNSIFMAGNGSNRVWRAPWVNGQYGPTVSYVNAGVDNEAVAIVPPHRLTVSAATAPAHVLNPGTVTFTLSWSNSGLTEVRNGVIVASLPEGMTFSSATHGGTLQAGAVTWSLGALAGGASGSVSFTGEVTAFEGSTITLRTYTIAAADVLTASGAAVSVTVEQPLQLAAEPAPNPVLIGQTVTFTLRYENLNALAATGVVIHAAIPEGTTFVGVSPGGVPSGTTITWSPGTLAAGAAGEVSFVVRADTGSEVTLSDYGVTCAELGSQSGAPVGVTVLPLPFDLAVAGTASPSPVTSGDELTYAFSFANHGGSTAPGTLLRSPIPAGTSFLSATGGGTFDGAAVTWPLGSLAPGANGTVTMTVSVTAPGGSTITSDATTIGSGTQTRGGPAIVTSVVAPDPPPPLTVTIGATPDPVLAGEKLEYVIVVSNPADVSADSVVLSCPIPAGTSIVTTSGPATATQSAVEWSLGTLSAGQSAAVGFTVLVVAPAGSSVVHVGALATAAGRSPASSGSVETEVVAPSATLAFTIVAPATAHPGDSIGYVVSYANLGPSALSGAVITDPLPPGTAFVSAAGGTLANGIVTWPVGTLAPGASGSFSLVVSVAASAGSTIVNSGSRLSATGAPAVDGPAAATDVVSPPAVFTGTLATDRSSYAVPEIVHQSASVTFASGGTGLMTGLTATLTTADAGGSMVVSATRAIDSIVSGTTIPILHDWDPSTSSTGDYTITFVVTDSAGNELVRRSLGIAVAAPDGARLSGTIAPLNSPVPLGVPLQLHVTVTNGNAIAYGALPLEVDLLDPSTLEVRRAVSFVLAVGANDTATTDVEVPTSGLTTGELTVWLASAAGSGSLLATSSATIVSPLLALTPSTLTLSAGSAGLLMATLDAPLTTSATLTLGSSDPLVVSVPATMPLPAGTTSVEIPLQARSVGGPVSITAALGTASASSSVTAVMQGTLTATARVVQGETVTFGVTVTNGGETAVDGGTFAVEIRNPTGGAVVDSVPFAASIAAGTTFTATHPYVSSSLAAQEYEAWLVSYGPVQHDLAMAAFEVVPPEPLRLQTSVGGPARVLIWSPCAANNNGKPCTPVAPPFLTATLRDAAIPYDLAGEEETFLAKMRTGAFSCAVIDQPNAAETKIATEYLADVHAGFGLLFAHSTPNAMPRLGPALGTAFLGVLQGPTTVDLLVTPFTSPGTLTLEGDGATISLAGAQAAATNVAGAPAMSYHTYGRGNVVVVPFDLERTPAPEVARLVLDSIGWVSRPVAGALAARDVVPLRFAVTIPPGGLVPVTVTVILPTGTAVIDAVPALSTTSPLSWSATLPGNSTTDYTLWVRLPDVAGTATVTVDAGNGGPPVVTSMLDLTVASDGASMASQLSAELATLRSSALTNRDQKAVRDAIEQLAAVTPTAHPLANVQHLLTLIEDLESMSIDTSAARSVADRLFVFWQSRIGA